MGKIKLSIGDKTRLKDALKINEEMQALLIPLLITVEKEASSDTHAMLRAVSRLLTCQYPELNELNDTFE
ncbi:hypothetical protein [Xenorhabdus bovienii]|nr:hypothetical protein [Xenorhabdus bovienii]MDE9589964.1 hypothetical protein [Xenorhabdus bovienii]